MSYSIIVVMKGLKGKSPCLNELQNTAVSKVHDC